jgi:pimeloyl-ACP methyl ester carboxylesterase
MRDAWAKGPLPKVSMISLRSRMSRLWRVTKFPLKMAISAMALAIIAGVAYEQIGRRQDLNGVLRIGRSVDIGGRSLNINCTGQGEPTVLLESGTNNPGYAWVLVQPMVSQFTRVCWYDRAGDGWSDSGPFPRTSEAIAKDLHALVTSAGIHPPYLLVGHSFGGTNIRVYSGLYPSDVAGMVLVDAWHEDEVKRLPSHKGSGPPDALRPVIDALTPAFTRIGLVRLFQPPIRNSRPPKGLSAEQWSTMQQLRRLPKAIAAEGSSGLTQEKSAEQVRRCRGLGDRPLIVLTAGKSEFSGSDPAMAKQAAADQDVWIHELQAQFVKLSTRGRQVIVENSTHGIPWEAPEIVGASIGELVATIRGQNGR